MSTAILENLLQTIGLEQNPGESNKDFSLRIYEKIKSVDEETWNKIGEDSEEVQEWYNGFHAAVVDGKKGKLVPGMTNSHNTRSSSPNGEDSDAEEKPRKRRVSPNKRSGEVTLLIRDHVFRNPMRAAKDIQAAVMEAGHDVKMSTIATTRASFLGALLYLDSHGHYHAPGLDKLKSNPVDLEEAGEELQEEGPEAAASGTAAGWHAGRSI